MTASSWNERAIRENEQIIEPHKVQPEQVIQPAAVVPVDSNHVDKTAEGGSPKKRKLSAEGSNIKAIHLKDQKEEADSALLKFQDLLHEVFEAEDQLEPDTSSAAVVERPDTIFTTANFLETSGYILSSDTHGRLQKAMEKVVGFGRLKDIPSDYINRIQKLCEKPIIASQAPELELNDPSSESDVDSWVRKLEDVLNALFAIDTLLQSMPGGQDERDLCPEGLIEAIPNVLNQAFDHCIIPAVESRPGGKGATYFECFASQKRIIGSLIQRSKKVLISLANFLSRIDVSDGTVNATEFFAAKLVFVENAYTDKESAVGFQRYESVRRGAMDVLAKIFSKYPEQRPYILDEILVSLEKLPSTRQSARQFKLADGKSIQFLTALVMQLVQTTALQTPTSRSMKARNRFSQSMDENENDLSEGDDNTGDENQSEASLEFLAAKVNHLYENAVRSAQYIVKFIVQRAMTSTKTGDQPYRNILDLFTEDLISVLGSTDWPATELILRIMASQMVGIADLDKSPATAKSMALELLGWMGSAISDLTVTAHHMLPAVEESGGELSNYLQQLLDDYSTRALHPQDLAAVDGPYRIALEYFLQDKGSDNWHITSARGYYLAQWAKIVCSIYYNPNDHPETSHEDTADDLVILLTKQFSDPRWLETNRCVISVTIVEHGDANMP